MKTKSFAHALAGGLLGVMMVGGVAGCSSEGDPIVLPTFEGEVSFGSPVAAGEGQSTQEELDAEELFEFGEGAGNQIEGDAIPEEAIPELPSGQEYAGDFDEVDLAMIEQGWVPGGRGNLALLPPVQVGEGSVNVPTNSFYSQEEYENAFIKARSLAAKNLVNTNVWRNNSATGLGERRSGFTFLDASEVGNYMVLDAQGKWYKDTESLGERNSSSVEALKVFEGLVSVPPEIDGSWSNPATSPFYEFESTVPTVLKEGPAYPGSERPSIIVGFTVTGYAGFFNEMNKLQVYKVSREIEYTMAKEPTGIGGSADWFLWKWDNGPTSVEKFEDEDIQEVGFNGSYSGDLGSNNGSAEAAIECDADGTNCRIVSE